MRRSIGLLLAVSLLVVAQRVRAEPSVPEANSSPPHDVWYGWQVMISDGLAMTALAASGNGRSDLAVTSLAIYGLGAPLVHAGNLQGWRALGSLGLRAAGLAAAFATFRDVGCREYTEGDTGRRRISCADATLGALMVLGAAAGIDAGALAHRAAHPQRTQHSPPAPHHDTPRRRTPDYMLIPSVELAPGRAKLGAVLVF
jgi:hypothetical protein